jgi:hypothetical protein
MHRLILCFSIFLLSFSLCLAQRTCRSVRVIVLEMRMANYIMDTFQRYGIVVHDPAMDKQHLRFIELKTCATKKDLTRLLRKRNKVVQYYAWETLLDRNPSAALAFILTNSDSLSKKKCKFHLPQCTEKFEYHILSHMVEQMYDMLVEEQIKLTCHEIVELMIFRRELQMNLSRSKTRRY